MSSGGNRRRLRGVYRPVCDGAKGAIPQAGHVAVDGARAARARDADEVAIHALRSFRGHALGRLREDIRAAEAKKFAQARVVPYANVPANPLPSRNSSRR